MNENNQNLNKKGLPRQGGVDWKPAVELFAQVSVWIVAPIVLALVFGKMLDTRYGTKPIIFLVLAGLGFLITCVGIFRVIKDYIKKLQEIEKENKNN